MSNGLYIHIPFCLKKCNYCDFISNIPLNKNQIDEYLKALKKEIYIYSNDILTKQEKQLDTIYIGGGTPSILNTEQLNELIINCKKNFFLKDNIEFTMEANPGTLDLRKLQLIYDHGINRLSIGIQSFDKTLLKKMGRVHDIEEAKEAVYLAKKVGFKNISIDLIYGLPEQTIKQWEYTLKKAIDLNIQHISAYGLKVEKNTIWGEMFEKGKLYLPEENEYLKMRKLADDYLLENGFNRYEISNYAKQGYESKHNLKYWNNNSFIGIGLAASSYIWKRRFSNSINYNKYIELLAKNQLPIDKEELITFKESMGDTAFLNLRLRKGVNKFLFKKRYGIDFKIIYAKEINYLKKLDLIKEDCKKIQLTKKGLPIANQVFSYFI